MNNLVLENYLHELYIQESILNFFKDQTLLKKIQNVFKDIKKSKNLDYINKRLNFIPNVNDRTIERLLNKVPNYKMQKIKSEKHFQHIENQSIKNILCNLHILCRSLYEDDQEYTDIDAEVDAERAKPTLRKILNILEGLGKLSISTGVILLLIWNLINVIGITFWLYVPAIIAKYGAVLVITPGPAITLIVVGLILLLLVKLIRILIGD